MYQFDKIKFSCSLIIIQEEVIKRFFDIIEDAIFPQVCSVCGKINKKGLCVKCRNMLEKLAIFQITKEDLQECYFQELISIFPYEGMIRQLLLAYKFNEKSYMYIGFVNFILKNKKIFEKLQSYDIVIPVPISKKRMKERGYNQSLVIAKKLSKDAKIQLQTNCLLKTRNIIEQSKLNKEQRKENTKNVYKLKNGEILRNKSILLIDDIFTTGSTANECCKILQEAMPKKIDVLTIAIKQKSEVEK